MKHKIISLLLSASLLIGTAVPTFAGSGYVKSTVATSAGNPAGVVLKDGAYVPASEGDKGVRYRTLCYPSIKVTTRDAGKTWENAAYTDTSGAPAAGMITMDYLITLPSAAATNLQAGAYRDAYSA